MAQVGPGPMHFWHAHFFKMADISYGPISKFKSRKLLILGTK